MIMYKKISYGLSQDYLRCPHYLRTAPTVGFEHHPEGLGYWCCDCQTFSWKKPNNNHQVCTLLLEQKSASENVGAVTSLPAPKFNKHLSPLRYPGGKSKLIDYLFAKLQPNKLDTFVEVFADGASFGLAL